MGDGPFLPLDGTPHRLSVGTRRIPLDRWLGGAGPDIAAELALRAELVADHDDEVIAVGPGAGVDDACRELLVEVAAFAGSPAVTDAGALDARVALRRVAVTVTDDFCLVDGASGLVVAGVVCFPNRWRITEKVGLPVMEVHGPVPGYAEKLGSPVDKLLAALRPGVVLERANWALLDDPTLFQPDPHPVGPIADPGTEVWARVERQSLRRLAHSGAVVFSIHTSQHRLDGLGATDRARLAVALETVPEPTAEYKGVAELRAPVLAWLRARA